MRHRLASKLPLYKTSQISRLKSHIRMAPLYINFNGEVLPADSKLLSVANRGFKYGDGLFESMRMLKGAVKICRYACRPFAKGNESP